MNPGLIWKFAVELVRKRTLYPLDLELLGEKKWKAVKNTEFQKCHFVEYYIADYVDFFRALVS